MSDDKFKRNARPDAIREGVSILNPLRDDERTALDKLIERDDFEIELVGWGKVDKPRVTMGHQRVQFRFWVHFDRPEAPMQVDHFKVILRTRTGRVLDKFIKRMPPGEELTICAGISFEMVWDMMLVEINPEFLSEMKVGLRGLRARKG